MVGQTVGKYRFVEKLGRGAMGTVYKAVDQSLGRDVAIKILNAELADTDVLKRFRAEASVLAKLNHPAIATLFELSHDGDDLLMVMEFVRGESLDQFVQTHGPMEPERAAYLLAQVLDAIGHAHAAGVIHRDLKPSNVMVTEQGAAKIMDFGIARVRGAEHMTSAGYMVGTPAYMSPEQVLCQEVDGRSDLYSIGVMFYRLLTGKLPFPADTSHDMVKSQISEAPTPARQHRAELPAWTLTILDRAMAKLPADRYQTAEEFRRALMDAIHEGNADATRFLPLAGVTASNTVATPPDATVDTSIATAILPTIVQPMPPASTDATTAATVVAPVAAPVASPPPPVEAQTAIAPTIVLPPPPTAARSAASSFTLSPALVALVVISAVAGAGSAWWHSRSAAPATTAAPAVATPAAASPSPTSVSEAPQTPTVAALAPATAESTATAAETTASSPAAAEKTKPATIKPTPLPNPAATPARTARGASESTLTEPSPEPPETPAPPPPAKEVAAPVAFAAKMLMREGDKARERDAMVRLADGQVTVTAPDRSVLSAVPYDALLSVIYSKSKQPLWNGPGGAIPIQKVESGAFGFLKGGRHWVSLRTKERFVILRLDENQVAAALAAIEERTGKPAVRVAEPKESQ